MCEICKFLFRNRQKNKEKKIEDSTLEFPQNNET